MARVYWVCAVWLTVASCGEGFGPITEFVRNRDKWDRLGLDSYTYEFQRGCFCGGDATQEVRITVSNNQVTAVVRVSDGQPIPPAEVDQLFRITIDSLFGIIAHAIDQEAHDITVTYDPQRGYPSQAFIDYRANVADEEQGWDARWTP